MSGWVDVEAVEKFTEGNAKLVNADGVDIAVFNIAGDYYAIEDVCTHDGSAMLGCGLDPEDVVDGDQIVCPRHGARFCIRSGTALTPPAYESVACFPVRIKDGILQTRDDRGDSS